MTEHRTVRFRVAPEDAGERLDKVLAARVPGLSRRRARVLLDIGGVFVDRARVKVASRALAPGQLVEAHLGGALDRAAPEVGRRARDRDDARLPAFAVRYRDADVIVVDKPAGLLAAPTPESDRGNLADLLARHLGRRAYVVHRIDLHTSGLLVYAVTRLANRALSAAFRAHDVRREYLAVVAGVPAVAGADAHGSAGDERVVDAGSAGDELVVDSAIDGRRAVTRLAVIERLPAGPGAARAALVRARLETGRTHQIRIHCERIGHPVLGDAVYGGRTAGAGLPWPPRTALHAARLGFAHPRTGEPLDFDSPWPDDLAAWLEGLRLSADSAQAAPRPDASANASGGDSPDTSKESP